MNAKTEGPWVAWDDGASHDRLRAAFPDLAVETTSFRGEFTFVVPLEAVHDVLACLRDDEECAFDFLTDVSAVHWPARPMPFDVVYHLYSFARNVRVRVKAMVGPEAEAPSVVGLWPGANWLERECYDMFGIVFAGHPDLRRILMTEDYDGWPLRKEHPLKQ